MWFGRAERAPTTFPTSNFTLCNFTKIKINNLSFCTPESFYLSMEAPCVHLRVVDMYFSGVHEQARMSGKNM